MCIKIDKFAGLLLAAFALFSCVDKNLYNPNEQGDVDYTQFENFKTINIVNEDANAFVSVFYENPYGSASDDDAITATAYASGSGAFSIQLDVPTHVKELFVLKNGAVEKYPVADLLLQVGGTKAGGTRAQSFSDDELNALVTEVRSKYFPSAKYNVRYSDLYTCCDLFLGPDADHQTEHVKNIDLSLVYLDDGHKGTGNLTGNMFIYLYPTAKMNDLTPDDCVFFGATDDGGCTTFNKHIVDPTLRLDEVRFSVLKEIGKKVATKASSYNGKAEADRIHLDYGTWPIFYTKNPEFNELKFSLDTLQNGRFLPSDECTWNMGFLYIGGQNLRYTTPALNIGYEGSADKQYAKYKAGAGNYLGYEVSYGAGEAPFIIDQNVSNGFVHHVQLNGKEYNVLGMENQYPYNKSDYYDGDYDDMMMIIVSNPSYIKPIKEIPLPNTEPSTFRQGYYLFEDNYPELGDYDFNDVIVQYGWRNYPLSNMNYISCGIVAKGCSNTNEFGFRVNGEYVPVIRGINGYYNVEGGVISTAETATYTYEVKAPKEDITPYLFNGNGYVCKTNQGKATYPYVLDVPYTDGKGFRWMTERHPIIQGYHNITSNGWYNNVKDETFLMKR